MGGQPSRSTAAAAHEMAVIERLHNLKIEEDEDYIEVSGDYEKAYIGKSLRDPEGLHVPMVQEWVEHLMNDPKNRLALTALSSANPRETLVSPSAKNADQQVFNIRIPFEGGPVTNQRQSGRCWLFASTNVFRVALMKRYGLESFELSQSYLFFWDKLEKTNWFLEQIVDTAQEDLDSRVVQTLLKDLVSDGGQWDMVYNLVEKYGLVPQSVYPDSWNAMSSGVLNSIVKTKLREFALRLRRLCNEDHVPAAMISGYKARMIKEISLIMTLLLGPPPKPNAEFTWQYLDKEGKAKELRHTPKEFAKDIYSSEFRVSSSIIQGMISLVHDPRHKELRKLTVSRLGNIVGGRDISYVNVGLDTLKSTCIKMLKAGLPIFFGCDVGKFSDSATGFMDLNIFNYEDGFNTNLLGMNKAERLMTGESQMTHAMVLTAVHVDEKTGKPIRWRVQNSWGKDSGDNGYWLMTDAWLDEFLFQAVVDPRFCSKEVTDVLKQEPIVLPLWDPMGALA